VQTVTVAPGVALEVLDYGGSGTPMVFLAGLGNTGHIFDDFAPQFTDKFHVVAITRRGFGGSSRPSTGYDGKTLSQDVVAVLDSLHLGRVVLVGHSIAGEELSRIAAAYPSRVSKLVYLDAAYSYGGSFPPVPPGGWSAAFKQADAAAKALRASVTDTTGEQIADLARKTHAPIAEVQWELRSAAPPLAGQMSKSEIEQKVIEGAYLTPFTNVHTPALAIYAVAADPNAYTPIDSAQRAQREMFRRDVKGSRVVELSGANHYVFISNPDDVVHAMREFVSQ
jgi:pimeloyl-ACP methyl ester carboxylesterase